MERLHDLKKGLFSSIKLSDLLYTGSNLELKKGTLLAHVNAPISRSVLAIKIGPFQAHVNAS